MQIKAFTITKKEPLTNGTNDSHPIFSFTLEPTDGINYSFTPGQFVTIFNDDKSIFRSYSISSSPNQRYIELLIEMIDGKLTSYLKRKETGDILMIGEPRGNFTLDKSHSKFVFLAAGVGIAPFLSMLRYSKYNSERLDSYIFYSVKHVSDIVYFDELKGYENHGAKLIINVTREKQIGEGFVEGRINIDEITKIVYDYKDREYLICGGLSFARSLRQNLIAAGIKTENIKSDVWGEAGEN